jgi:hypothetical protein
LFSEVTRFSELRCSALLGERSWLFQKTPLPIFDGITVSFFDMFFIFQQAVSCNNAMQSVVLAPFFQEEKSRSSKSDKNASMVCCPGVLQRRDKRLTIT